MRLSRTTPARLFKIGTPKWNGKAQRREVGLALNRIAKHNEIEFTYIRKSDGKKSIPDHYYFDGDKLNQVDYERQVVSGTTLVIIPFRDLEVLERA